MRCSHCDQVLRTGAAFCSRCGVPVRAVSPSDGDTAGPARPAAQAVATLDGRRVAGAAGGALLVVAAFLPWTHVPFAPAQNAFSADSPFPLGVVLVACGVLGAALALRGIGEKVQRGAASIAAAATALFVLQLDGGLDAAQVGALVAIAGAVALAASGPVPRSLGARPSASGGPQFEEVV